MKPIRFDTRWRAADASLKTSVNKLTSLLEDYERKHTPRQRRRRAADKATHLLGVEVICANLLVVSLAAPNAPLAVPLQNSASKLSPIWGKTARKIVETMVAMDFITKVKGYPYRGPTTIKPTSSLRRLLRSKKLDLSALRLADDPKTIILKRTKGATQDSPRDVTPVRAGRETPKTRRWLRKIASEMETINDAIRNAAIECKSHAEVHIFDRPNDAMASIVTSHHRSLRRIFNETWKQGGRLFGGFWQTVPRSERFRDIRIGGEAIALVDYGQLFLRFAYAEAKCKPPAGDLYDVTGKDHLRSDWARLRDARKKLVNALFFRRTPLRQWPGATLHETAEMRVAFAGMIPREAIEAIKQKHHPIAAWFERGHGLRFMRQESDLLVRVLMRLLKQRIVALPIHDAVLVAERHAATAKRIMEEEARRMTGSQIPADIETASK